MVTAPIIVAPDTQTPGMQCSKHQRDGSPVRVGDEIERIGSTKGFENHQWIDRLGENVEFVPPLRLSSYLLCIEFTRKEKQADRSAQRPRFPWRYSITRRTCQICLNQRFHFNPPEPYLRVFDLDGDLAAC
jgi:hypothetical protein